MTNDRIASLDDIPKHIEPTEWSLWKKAMLGLPGCVGVALYETGGKLLERTGRISEWHAEQLRQIVVERNEIIAVPAFGLFQCGSNFVAVVKKTRYIVVAECRGDIAFGHLHHELGKRWRRLRGSDETNKE